MPVRDRLRDQSGHDLRAIDDHAQLSSYGTARALWNRTYDAGYEASPAVFSVFVTCAGSPAAFALAGMLMLAGLA